MLLLVVQALALALGLGLAALWPRESRPLLDRSSVVNVVTGGLLYALKTGIGLTGVYTLHVGGLDTSWLPGTAAQAVFAFVVVDLARYGLHRMHHAVPFFWSFHRVHHSPRTLDSTAGFRLHVVDFVQLTAVPVLLFSVVFDTRAWSPLAVPLAMIPGIVADALEHANLRFPAHPRWLRYVFNNPLFHAWHHTRNGDVIDGNYANALPLWDVIFGSDVTQDAPPPELGLNDAIDLDADVVGLQLLRPARR